MDMLNRHIPVTINPALADARRKWLKAHPAWMVHNGFALCLLRSIGPESEALYSYPGPLWLRTESGQADSATLERIAELHGLEGLSLYAAGVDDAAFSRLVRGARGLRCLWLREVGEITDKSLCRLAELSELEGLEIGFDNSGIRSTAFLSKFSGENSPRSLVVQYPPLTRSELANITWWTRLEACDISLAANVRDDFSWLSHLKNLRYLKLNCASPVTPSAMAQIGELRELTMLELWTKGVIEPEGLAFLSAMEKLETLTVHAERITPAGGSALARSNSVRDLNISGLEVTTRNMANIAAMPKLENLCWNDECLSKPDFAVMAKTPRLRHLTFTELTRPWIVHPTTDRDLAGLAGIKGLGAWSLRGDKYTARGLASLAELPELTELSLEGIGSWDEGALSCLADFPSLTTLFLDFNDRDKPSMRCFSFLKDIRNLTSLTVSLCNGWNESMLDDVSSAPGLKHLGFWNTPRLSGEWLAKLRRLPQLEEFTLFECPGWRDGDIRPLAGIRTLRRIHISGCDGITAKGLLHLRDISLETIDINLMWEIDMGIFPETWPTWSARALMALRQVWPEAEIC